MDFLRAPARQASVVEVAAHRPWPLPEAPWAQAHTWEELAFLHWRLDPDVLRPHVPTALELDVRDGASWLGMTPFRLSGLRLRGLPPLPLVSWFPELNVRTYVSHDGRPGIWFLSLDTPARHVVEAGRRLYKLPYRHARTSVERHAGWVHADSARPGHVLSARYRGVGDPFQAEPGSLEWFLTERYCLYAAEGETLYRADIHHPPWRLQAAEAAVELNTMPPPEIELPDERPLAHFSSRQDVLVWGVERVA